MSYASTQDELADHVRVQVAVGHAEVDAVVEEAAYMFGIEEDAVRPLAEAAWAAAEAAMETWPDVTDCDRLDAAFAALDRAGIRARQHFACCNTCGHYEMTEDIHFARQLRDAQIDGYVFYHRQDAEAAVTDRVLHLRYATIGGDDTASAAIGRRVEAALRDAGLAATWEGDSAKTIQLRDFHWQRGGWPDDEVEPPIDLLAVWCAAFERTMPSDFVASLGEPFLHALDPDLAVRFARAASTSSLAPKPRAALLGSLARRDPTLWREAFACCPLWSPIMIELLLDADLTDPALREAVRLRIVEMRSNALGGAAMAWFAVSTGTADEHLRYVMGRRLASEEDAPSAKVAIRAALWALGDDTMRAPVVDALTGDARYRIDAYGVAAGARAAKLRGGLEDHDAIAGPRKSAIATLAEAEAQVAKMTEGFDEGLYTSYELEAARYELALLQGDLAGLAARYRDEQRAARADLRAHLEAVRDGATPRIVAVDPAWLAGSREKTIQRNITKWQTAKTRDERRRERRPAERVLLAATSIASVDHDRAVALVDAILDGDETDLLGADIVIAALLAVDRLDAAVDVADDGFPGCAGLGPLITARALAGELDDARARLAKTTPYLYAQHNVQATAMAAVAVADDREAAATAVLDAWDRGDAVIDSLAAAVQV